MGLWEFTFELSRQPGSDSSTFANPILVRVKNTGMVKSITKPEPEFRNVPKIIF